MDTGSDFIQPEFLNIVFFQQKNLVVFPYVDLRHLHGLEIFTAGYNVVDLESTALHNLKEILEFESNNSYSQNPTLYFIFNVDREKVKELMELDGIRCIINSNENISNLANGSKFIFFNKKNNQFLNYNITAPELEFENSLITSSQDEDILQENIQKIKIAATRIFKELNQSGTLETLPDILGEYDRKYWNSILEFTSRYYDINIPDISGIKFKPQKRLKDFSDEYEVLISTNRALGKEFIQLLHDFRSKRVNPAHLELDELYNPQKLYSYLRNHHWKEGIPKDFVEEWYQMNISDYQLSESDQLDFEKIVKKLGLEVDLQNSSSTPSKSTLPEFEVDSSAQILPIIPSPRTDWNKYKDWIEDRLTDLERLSSDIPRSSNTHSYIDKEFSDIHKLLNENVIKNREEFQDVDLKERSPMNNELLIVDITNILNLDKTKNGSLKIDNILNVRNTLKSLGYKPLMIADANMRYYPLDNPQLYEELLQKGTLTQAPAGRKADEFVLEFAKTEDCKFLANDMYKDFYKEFGREWIFEHRLACMLVNGKLIMR